MSADRPDQGGPLRVGVVVPSVSGGGAEFVAVQWARHLRAHGHAVTMITTHDPTADLGEVPVVGLTASSFPARVRALREHVSGAGYDVLLGLMPHWNLLVLLAALGRPDAPATLISGRNVEAPLRRIHGLSYRVELALCQLLYRRADGYVAISHPVAAEAASRYALDPETVWVVPNPATGKDPAAAAALVRGHRTATGGESVTLTVPARLVPQKRPELAVETAARLRDVHGVETSVDYFGAGPEESAVRAAGERLGVTVRFRGWVTSWFEAAAADAVVLLPSAAEGFGNVLVEAAAAGMASVASSRALGVADAIVPNVTGVFAMGSSPDDFAAAVRRAMTLTPVSAPAWLERFSPDESGAKLLQVLRAVTDGRNPASTAQPRATSDPASPYSRSA